MSRRNRKPLPTLPVRAQCESLDQKGRAVAHVEGKAVFIDGALPGEDIQFHYVAQHKRYDEGCVAEIITPSPQRVTPPCEHFGLCGGCSLQHLAPEAQIAAKQRVLNDALTHIGKVAPEAWLPPLTGPVLGYRRRARLGAKYVIKKQTTLVGFREKRSAYLAELTRCVVLEPAVGERIMALRELIDGMHAREHLPQIEVAAGDAAVALVFRHMTALDEHDLARLCAFGEHHELQIWLQPQGPDSVHRLWPIAAPPLSYSLPEFDVEMEFLPTDFVQVNGAMNRAAVQHAIQLLAPTPDERVLDLFCGLGNFTLPLARRAAAVVGVEGEAALIARAQANARHNAITNADFHVLDLTQSPLQQPWYGAGFDKVLIDPPRTGALEVMAWLPQLQARRIVYVSCNPATLARDAGELIRNGGYRLVSAGVMDMFPHTTHVESIAVFER